MKVREVMTPDVMTCKMSDKLVDCSIAMKDLNVGVMPVVSEDDNLVGIITDRDVTIRAVALGADPNKARVGEFMTPSPETVRPDINVEDAAERMANLQVRRLPVVDDSGKLIGIVSLGDLAVDVGEPEMIEHTLEKISEPVRSERE